MKKEIIELKSEKWPLWKAIILTCAVGGAAWIAIALSVWPS